MARPIKTGLAYFPLDTDFFTNKKINNLRRAHGSIGVLTYLNLLCRVYSNGYFYRFDDINELAMDIAEEIANSQLRATATRVTETINYLVGRGILDEGLFKQGIISGEALQEQYVMSAYKAKRKIEMGVHSLVDAWVVVGKNDVSSEETIVCSEETRVSSEFGTQSKSKNKNNITTTTTTEALALAHAHAREEVEKGMMAPSRTRVFKYMKDELMIDDPATESEKFFAYNELRGWDCLPRWKEAAELWSSRTKDKKR